MAVQEGTFSILANKVMFANKLSLIFKATADNESPTPGYMFQEIINISNESGSHCLDLLEVLAERLQEESCNVKLKVLRIMKHVVEKGHPDFTSALRKKSSGIQAATKHNGPPDPLHGNVPYLLVRKEAQTLLSVLFEVKDDSQVVSPQGLYKPIGSISSVGIGSVDSSGTLRGFGNTPMREKSLTESFINGLKDVAEKVFDPPPHPLGIRPPRETHSFSQYKPVSLAAAPPMEGSTVTFLAEDHSARPKRTKSPRQKGRVGGGWDDEPIVLGGPPALQHSVRSHVDEQTDGAANTESEESLMAEWLEVDTNTSLLPSRKQVEEFVKKCCALNCDKISGLLSSSLEDERDPVLLRSMLALEKLLHLDLVGADHMASTCTQHLWHLKQHKPAGAVRSKARKILCVLEKLCSNQEIIKNLKTDTQTSQHSTGDDARNKENMDLQNEDTASLGATHDGHPKLEMSLEKGKGLFDTGIPSPVQEALFCPFAPRKSSS